MRFLVDECAGPGLAAWLRNQGHAVYSVFDEHRGIDDETIIRQAWTDNWIVVTADKDFGTKVFREQCPHHGVVLLRLSDERTPNMIAAMDRLLKSSANQLTDRFVVVTDVHIRFAGLAAPRDKPR
jgi:predicted nuclease of predicted toxin-antitoxin system